MKLRRRLAIALLIVAAAAAGGWYSVRPSHDREWGPEQARVPTADILGDSVHIRGVRDFRWDDAGNGTAAWDERSYRLSEVRTVWFVLTPFSRDWRGPAHAFLSFGFADSQYVAVSVEARREDGEDYSLWKGLLKRFELLYVIGDERDLIGLRTARGDDVYLYPIRATPEQARALFVEVLARANGLAHRPEFYGTLRNNCTTNILRHVNRVATRPIRYGPRIFLPGYSDAVAHELGLIDTTLPLDEARRRFRITDRVKSIDTYAEDFSARLRDSEAALRRDNASG